MNRRNPQCCCDVPGCCQDTDLKDLPTVSYDPSTSTYTFSETQWYYTDSNGDRQTHFTGDVPADGSSTPNILPAGSTVQAEFNICCLDYIFEVEVLTWDSADDDSYIKAGATQFRSADSGSSSSIKAYIQSRTSYGVLESNIPSANFPQGYQQGYAVFEMGSFLGNGSTEELINAFNYHPRRSSVNYTSVQLAAVSDGKGDASWAVNLSRPIKLTIHAGNSDIQIGAIRLRQGANTRSSSTLSCINYSGYDYSRPTASGVFRLEWPLVRTGVSIYKDGYGTTVLNGDAVGRTACSTSLPPALYNARTQPKHTYTNTFDYSGKNGNWSYELVRLNAGATNPLGGYTSASLEDQNSIDALATACRTDDWESISLIPDWWNLYYVEPTVCPPAVPDNTNCASGAGSPYSADSSCTSPTTNPSFTSSNSWPWYFPFSVNTSQPCPYYDLLDFTDQTHLGFYRYGDTTELYQTYVPWGGYGDPNFAGASLQSTIGTYLTTVNPSVKSGCDVDGFTSSKAWQPSFLNFVPTFYGLTNSVNGVPDRYESSNATGNFSIPDDYLPTVSHSSNAFAGTIYSADQSTVASSGYMERQLSFTVSKTWVENVQGTNETLSVYDEVQGDWIGETLQYVEYQKASIPDTKQGRTTYAKVHQNCIHDFEVISTPYTGSPPTAGTPVTVSQTGQSTIPNLLYQGSSTTRPSGVYDDGKIYEWSDDGFNRETYFWSSVGYFLHEVRTDDGDTYHILFGDYSVIVEIRRLSDNTKFSGTTVAGSVSGCSGQGYSHAYGSTSVEGTVTEISFVLKGSR